MQPQAVRITTPSLVLSLPHITRVKPLRWYIMTSPATDAETKKHFRSNGFFGLKESQASLRAVVGPHEDAGG